MARSIPIVVSVTGGGYPELHAFPVIQLAAIYKATTDTTTAILRGLVTPFVAHESQITYQTPGGDRLVAVHTAK
jgi:hypothetical protein